MINLEEKFKNASIGEIGRSLIEAFDNNDIKQVKFLLKHTTLENSDKLQSFVNDSLIKSCEHGNLSMVQYLLTSTELKLNAAINARKGLPLINACGNGHLDIVKYLLTSPELKEHANIHIDNDSALISACGSRHLNVFKYLLTSSELKDHANLNAREGEIFDICFKHNQKNDRLEIINYLIFDLNIERTEYINNLLTEYPNEKVEEWFKLRKLNNELNKELPLTEIGSTNKKNKL